MQAHEKFLMMSEVSDIIKGILQIKNGHVILLEPAAACGWLVDRLIYNAVFHHDTQIKGTSRWLIKAIAQEKQIFPASIKGLYAFLETEKKPKMTIPVVRFPGLSYPIARAVIRAAQRNHASAFIFEIEKSQDLRFSQTPGEFVCIILASAIREGFTGPVFIQTNHFQIDPEQYDQDPSGEKNRLLNLIEESIRAGSYNLWLDGASMELTRGSKKKDTLKPQAHLLAELTHRVHTLEPPGIDICIGAKLGSGKDPTDYQGELQKFMKQYEDALHQINQFAKKVCKISFLSEIKAPIKGNKPGFSSKQKKNKTKEAFKLAQEKYHLMVGLDLDIPGFSQEHIKKTYGMESAEIQFPLHCMNLFLQHREFPAALKEELMGSFPNLFSKSQDASRDSQSAFERYKEGFWTLPPSIHEEVGTAIEKEASSMFTAFRVNNTEEIVHQTIPSQKVPLNLTQEIEECKSKK